MSAAAHCEFVAECGGGGRLCDLGVGAVPSLLASVRAIYPALVLERATVGCLFDFHEIAPFDNMKA